MPKDVFNLAYSVRMQEGESDTAEVMLYGEIIEDMPEHWKWSKEDKSAADFKRAIEKVRADGAKKLLLRINSPGGVCTQSVAMRSILANAGFDEINIRIEGMCASAATDIATLPGAHVAIAEGSEYMIHNPWCFALGNANELEHVIERLRNIEQMSRGFYMKRTGQEESKIKEWMDAETWFTADQAVEFGFADEVLKAETSGETPAAACVSGRVMATMRDLYKGVPDRIREDVSNGAPAAGEPTEIHNIKEENQMELHEITEEQLREGNPALYEEIQQSAVNAERTRLEEIDALTIPGYEEMAEQAKTNGTSVMDFQKQLVKAMKEKGANFLSARQVETDPAKNVAGGAPDGNTKTEDQEIMDNAKDVAKYGEEYYGNRDENGMF